MQKTFLEDWTWDEEPMREVEQGLEEYISDLFVALHMEEDIDTLSGFGFDGCATCETREYIAYLMPKLLDMYANGEIALAPTTRMQHGGVDGQLEFDL